MPKISVIVVTNRKGWHEILCEDLKRQTFRDFEIIIANDSGDNHECVIPEFNVFIPRQKNEGDAWNLNKAYNDCFD